MQLSGSLDRAVAYPLELPMKVKTFPSSLGFTIASKPFNTHFRLLPCLLLVALLASLTGLPALAQESQQESDATGLISGTVEHVKPQPRAPFTSTRPASGYEQELQPEASAQFYLHPESIHDDFDDTTPTAWWVYTGQTAAQVSSTITADNARIIDIQVDSVSPSPKFTVTYVHNTGAYAKTWWWYYGMTVTQVSSFITTNNARLISVKAYDAGAGQIRYAVVMIRNTGVDQKAWWWYVGQSISDISSKLQTNNARLIAVDPYQSGGSTFYTAIMISNTGADADAWWWYVNVSPATLSTLVSQHKARITYMTPGSTGTFNAIMEGCPSSGCSEWWYYYGYTAQQMVNKALQNGARLLNFASYPGCGSVCFTGAMINNSNAITTRVGNIIRTGNIAGTEGLYLKKVGGPVIAALEDNVVFEPASTIKALANLYATSQVQHGAIALTTPIKHYTNGPDSCPNPATVSGTEPLGTALREMMFHSDNARTREITDRFTDTSINAYAISIGMKNSGFHEIVGCIGATPDKLTLDDAGTLYESVANQTSLNAKYRGVFYSNMAGRAQFESEGYDWTGLWSTDIPNLINQVAPAGYTAAQKTAYYQAMNLAYKAGNYVVCTNNDCSNVVEDVSIAGWFQVPVCSATSTTYAEYVFGIMFSNEPNTGWFNGKVTQTDTNFKNAKGTLLREQIQAGMASCLGKPLDVLTYGPADLVFPSTAIGATTAVKTVTLSNKQLTAAAALSISVFGDFSETNNCGTSLAAGKSCTISVKFTPTQLGERTGAVIVADSGSGQPQTVQLTGTGKAATPAAEEPVQ